MTTVQKVLRMQTTVKPGGEISVADPELRSGESVEVIILLPASIPVERRSALDILAELPGQRLFKTAGDVESYLEEERSSWDR